MTSLPGLGLAVALLCPSTGQLSSIQNRSPDHSYIVFLLLSGLYDSRAFEVWSLLNSLLIFLIFGNTLN